MLLASRKSPGNFYFLVIEVFALYKRANHRLLLNIQNVFKIILPQKLIFKSLQNMTTENM